MTLEQFAALALVFVNFVAFVLFLILLGATLASMGRRVMRYRRAGEQMPVILKRGLVLFGAFALLGGEAAALRMIGLHLEDDVVMRLVYTVQADIVLLGALAYFAKTDLYDIDNPSVP